MNGSEPKTEDKHKRLCLDTLVHCPNISGEESDGGSLL